MTTRNIETGTDTLTCTVKDHIATITLNRPDKRNAFNPELIGGLNTALRIAEADPDVRVLIVTGTGDVFCAGGDVSSMRDNLGVGQKPSLDATIRGLQHMQTQVTGALYDFAKPTIAVLPGAAAGAGMSIAMACDLRIAADTARLVPAFGAIGASGDFGGTWLLSHLIGAGRAKEIYFTGRTVSASEALSLGIFNRVVPAASLNETAQETAAHLAAQAPIALRYMKQNHNHAIGASLAQSMEQEADRMMRCLHSEDHKEGVAAFFEKRTPVFKGQ